MGSGAYLLILFLGAVIVVADGQLILRSSRGYLAEVYDEPRRAQQVSGLAAVLFHLVMLGVVALVASVGLADDAGIQSILARIGVLLLFTAIAHGLTIAILSRLREQQLSTQIAEAQMHERQAADGNGTATPSPDISSGIAGRRSAGESDRSPGSRSSDAPADKPGL